VEKQQEILGLHPQRLRWDDANRRGQADSQEFQKAALNGSKNIALSAF
jgi:hypothetical protein